MVAFGARGLAAIRYASAVTRSAMLTSIATRGSWVLTWNASSAHPERFVKKHPTVQSLHDTVWINRPQPLLETGVEPPL